MKRTCLSLLFCLFTLCAMAQDSLLHFKVEAQGIYNSNGQVPFWFRSNQFGSIPLDGASTSFIGSAIRDYSPDRSKLFDWGAGFEGRSNLGNAAQATLIEAYAKVRLGMFQLKGGRSKEIMGIVGDSILSSGSFSVSGNALGVPQVSLSIPEFYTIPVFGGLFAVKGNFAHGWLGTLPLKQDYRIPESKTYFHQKSLYARIGTPEGKFKFYAGFNHQAFWGNYSNIFPKRYDPISTWQEFVKVITGQVYNGSKVGNHLGSIDLAVELTFPKINVKLYRQNIYDIGGLSKLSNLRDGLNGVTLTNRERTKKDVNWKGLTIEVFYTKDQGGYPWSKKTKSGAENYYNNYQYDLGWSYEGLNLGNPFIANNRFTRSNLVSHSADYFLNNRVFLLNAGLTGSIKTVDFTAKLSYSKNFGTHRTSGEPYQSVYGVIVPGNRDLYFKPVNQFSFYLEGRQKLQDNLTIGLALAGDQGGLLYNSIGGIASISKSF